MHTNSLERTFAGLSAVKPRVVNVSVSRTSATLVPSSDRSATTDSAGFRERATLWELHRRVHDH